jgi:hypothetical protein
MEAAMSRYLATIAGTLAILSGAVLVSDSDAQAGASASAPSKYNHANQVAAAQQANRQAHRNDFGITEYSSSSAKNTPRR